jgi:hypothetical protein
MMDKLKKLLERFIPVLSAEEIIAIGGDMDIFGSTDPAKMPGHLFHQAVERDWSTAVRANIDNQNYTVCPRHWYVDAVIPCEGCGEDFTFSAEEQRLWYETYHFYVDSFPQRCLQCRRSDRRIKSLRQDYDRLIAAALASDDRQLKARLVGIIDSLVESGTSFPDRIQEKRRVLLKQIAE